MSTLDIARKCFEDAAGNPPKAIQLLLAAINSNPGLQQKALEHAAREWLYEVGMTRPTINFPGSFTVDTTK